MLQFDKAPKRATNLSLNARVLDRARELGMNISQTVDALLSAEVERRYWEKWRDENQGAFADYNQQLQREGLPLARYRSFARSAGDGKD